MRWLAAILFLLFCFEAEAANRFLTCNTACTITASDTTIWGTTTGGTGASVPGSSDAVILDGATCVGGTTCTATMGVGYNPTWQSITMGACTASTTGCIFDWSVNNNSPTLTAAAAFSGTGSGTRNLKMGNGTWTFNATGAGSTWDMTTTTNLTFSANSSIIAFTGNAAVGVTRTFIGGGLTYSTVTVAPAAGSCAITGTNTFAVFTMTGQSTVTVANNMTMTTLNLTGSSGSPVFLSSNAMSSQRTLTITTLNATWAAFRSIIGTGTATNSFDLGGNSGITITAPQTGGGGRIIGGWLLRRDLYHNNDNSLAWLEKAA